MYAHGLQEEVRVAGERPRRQTLDPGLCNLNSHFFFRQALNKMCYYTFFSPTLLAISGKERVIGTYK